MKWYNPEQVALSIDGVPLDAGFGPDDFISIEWDSPLANDAIGSEGEVTGSKSRDDRATVTITCMQTSTINAILTGFLQARLRGEGSLGVFSMNVTDTQNGESFDGAESWVNERPTIAYGREVGTREWKIRVAKGEYVHLATG